MLTLEKRMARRLRVHGLVQGVGFRPAVHRLASELNLSGWVCNDGAGVLIHLEGPDAALDAFARRLAAEAPDAARIEAIDAAPANEEGAADFHIRSAASAGDGPLGARVPVDRALCAACRAEVRDGAHRRGGHPFATCTHCGPRYSLIRNIPYEREATGMAGFGMCRACRQEYGDPADRRFHAETIACPACGPRLGGGTRETLDAAADALRTGRIVALKGLGGYQLLVRADDNNSVARLRQRKRRPTRPFAVMVRSLAEAERVGEFTPGERACLLGAENPIVLAQSRGAVAPAVAPGLKQIGVFLPTTPLHQLLLDRVAFPVVATSGNASDEPIAIDEAGRAALEAIADVFVDHDRPILRRVDDSLVRVIDETPMVLRLARGLAPFTLPALERWASGVELPVPPMLAVGGQQKTALALWTGAQAILAQHLGDMDHPETRRAFATATTDLTRLYRCEPRILACDLHPEYFTTRWAQAQGPTCFAVQHHHAHAAACMVEHDLVEREVLGILFDGTGFGTDGTIWGGEIARTSIRALQRVASLDLFALPGGESAIREPWRIAYALVADIFGAANIPGWLLERLGISQAPARALTRMIERGVNSPRTSSVGRLFDAAAALILKMRGVAYEGEAAMYLEAAVDAEVDSAYAISMRRGADGLSRGDWRPLVRGIVDDLANQTAPGICAARFHNALAGWAADVAAQSPGEDVVLGGGCFQNAHLTHRTRLALAKVRKNVYVPGRIPANDGGLAVGQIAVAMARWRSEHSR